MDTFFPSILSCFQCRGNLCKQLIRVGGGDTTVLGGPCVPLWAAALTSGHLARLHCVRSLGEETEDADKKALPVQPDRHRKASAEERLDTVPDLESNKEGQGTTSRLLPFSPPYSFPSSLWVVLFIVGGGQQRKPCLLVQSTETASWVWKDLFLDQFSKHDLQIKSLHLGKQLMSRKGNFLFPQETRC